MKTRKPLTPRPCKLLPYDSQGTRCARCGKLLTGGQRRWCGAACREIYEVNHYWQLARPAALKRDHYGCVRCGSVRITGPEVNHKVPRNGQGYAAGCHHHLDNLETLCHTHHLEVTAHQRIARARHAVRKRERGRADYAQGT